MDNNSKKKSAAATFGGGESRMIYEGKKKKSDIFVMVILIVMAVLVSGLAIVGIVSVIKGYFPGNDSSAGGNTPIKVPLNSEIQSAMDVETMIEMASEISVVLRLNLPENAVKYQTGFFISDDGHIATEMTPDIKNGNDITVSLYSVDFADYIPVIYDGSVEALGIAFFHIEPGATICPSPSFMNSSFAKTGQSVWALPASNSDFTGLAKHGIISAISRDTSIVFSDGRNYTLIYVDFEINSTLSGAPVFNSEGKLLGMITSQSQSEEKGISSIIPINTVILLGNNLINSK